MAVPTGSGTETLHSGLFEDVGATATTIITGVQHHVYTVLSCIVCCKEVHASANTVHFRLAAYDALGGTGPRDITLGLWTAQLNETFVWNDKFSFFGTFPSANTQIGRAAQGASTAQLLKIASAASDCKLDVTVTFIDQDFS